MPFMSDKEVYKMRNAFGAAKAGSVRVKQRLMSQKTAYLATLQCIGAAGGMGWLRGKREDSIGVWNLPFVKFDMELSVGLGLLAASYFANMKKLGGNEMYLNMGNGILAHYTGQIARKFGKTGVFSQVAGLGDGGYGDYDVGALPQFDPTSWDPTQISAPFDDPVAAALAQSGV